MNANRALALGIVATALLGGANASLKAQDGCQKWCGCISTWSWGTRWSPQCSDPTTCAYASCVQGRSGCSEAVNDACGTPDWCENTQSC